MLVVIYFKFLYSKGTHISFFHNFITMLNSCGKFSLPGPSGELT